MAQEDARLSRETKPTMKDALTRMEDIEAKFRVKASELGLDLDKLYERHSHES